MLDYWVQVYCPHINMSRFLCIWEVVQWTRSALCSWQSLLRHSPRPTQRRAIITRHGNNQLVKQEEAARCAPMCGERELEDVWRLRKKQQAGVSIYYIQEEPFWGWIMSCESCPLCLNETEIYIYIFNMKTCIQKTIYQSINVWTTVQMFEVSIFFVSIYK